MQTRLSSFTEAALNTASGFIVALIAWHFIAIAYGIPMPLETNLQITGIMTVLSIARSYVWRRLFNARGERVKADIRVAWNVIDGCGCLRCQSGRPMSYDRKPRCYNCPA